MPRRLPLWLCGIACETERKRACQLAARSVLFAFVLSTTAIALSTSRIVLAQPTAPPPAGESRRSETEARPESAAAAAESNEAAEHDEGALPTVARLVNFVILIGTLVYLLRSPL